jgi:hypothetical protein
VSRGSRDAFQRDGHAFASPFTTSTPLLRPPSSVTMADSTQPDAKKRKVDEEHSTLAPTSGLLIKRLSEKARLPTRGSPLAAGYDLYR